MMLVQEGGEVDIVCLEEARTILITPLADLTVTMYSNNEPHIHLANIKRVSVDAIAYAKESMIEVRAYFNKLGYGKIYTMLKETDKRSEKLVMLMGFVPKIIYEDPIGTVMIKYDMETKT